MLHVCILLRFLLEISNYYQVNILSNIGCHPLILKTLNSLFLPCLLCKWSSHRIRQYEPDLFGITYSFLKKAIFCYLKLEKSKYKEKK
jgi:hypothetical protein